MNVTKFDIGFIFALSAAVVLMSFAAPVFGMDGTEQGEEDIPEYNTTADRFDFAGAFPANPGGPSKGYLRWEGDSDDPNTEIWASGDESDGVQLAIQRSGPSPDDLDFYITITKWLDGNRNETDTYTFDEGEGDTYLYNKTDYEIYNELTEEERNDSGYLQKGEIEFRLNDQPTDENWIERVPVVGGVFSAGEQLASIVGWIGSVLYWVIQTAFELIVNLVAMLFEAIAYLFSMFHWMLSTYWGVVEAAPGWSAVIVALPGVMLGAEFAKLALVGVALLPTT